MPRLTYQNLKFEIYPGVFSQRGLDFGSLLLLKDVTDLSDLKTILDLGCGCGVLGLSLAANYPEAKVYLVDSDIRAVRNARLNARLNKIKNVEISIGDWTDDLPPGLEFDLIVANPPTHQGLEILEKFLNGAHQRLRIGGRLMVVMNRLTNMMTKIEARFGNVEKLTKKKGYIVMRAVKT